MLQITGSLVDVLSSNQTQVLFKVCHLARSSPSAPPLHVAVPAQTPRKKLLGGKRNFSSQEGGRSAYISHRSASIPASLNIKLRERNGGGMLTWPGPRAAAEFMRSCLWPGHTHEQKHMSHLRRRWLFLLGVTLWEQCASSPTSLPALHLSILRFFGEQPPLLYYDGLQPGSAVGSRFQQAPICSFVKAWGWQ